MCCCRGLTRTTPLAKAEGCCWLPSLESRYVTRSSCCLSPFCDSFWRNRFLPNLHRTSAEPTRDTQTHTADKPLSYVLTLSLSLCYGRNVFCPQTLNTLSPRGWLYQSTFSRNTRPTRKSGRLHEQGTQGRYRKLNHAQKKEKGGSKDEDVLAHTRDRTNKQTNFKQNIT